MKTKYLLLLCLFLPIASCSLFQRKVENSLSSSENEVEKAAPQEQSTPPPATVENAAPTPVGSSAAAKPTEQEQNESNYEWALQFFEAGQYSEALERFLELEKLGATIKNFHLIPYYLGKIYFSKAEFSTAATYLEKFITYNPKHSLSQEARILLLRSYSTLREWKKIITLASDTVFQEAYGGRKILVGLLWAEALMEEKELLGAKKVLQETKNIFSAIPEGSQVGDSVVDSLSYLKDRFYWLESKLSIHNCDAIQFPKSSSPKKIFSHWLQERGKCLQQILEISLPVYTRLSPEWNQAVTNILSIGIESFADTPQVFVQNQVFPTPKAQEFSRPIIRKYFYQMISAIRRSQQYASIPSPSTPPYDRLIRKIETILQKITIESSSSGHTL